MPSSRGGWLNTVSFATRAVLAPPGLLASTSGGLALSTEAFAGRLVGATAGMLYLPEARTTDPRFAFGLTAAWLGVCAQPWRSRAGAMAICGKALFGAIHSVVYILTPEGPGDQFWMAGSISVAVRLSLAGPLFGELGGELVAPAPWTQYRFNFTVDGQSRSAFQEKWVSGYGFVGLGLSIP